MPGMLIIEGWRHSPCTVESGYTLVSAEPQITFGIFENAVNHIVRQAVRHIIIHEHTTRTIHPVYTTAVRADP